MNRVIALIAALALLPAAAARGEEKAMTQPVGGTPPAQTATETITLGGGCFWCLEAVFQQVKGVRSVESGYSGGTVPDPSYQEVCTGSTGHAEVVQVAFDPKAITLHDILTIFFTLHDPTTLNRQGADIGSQYRSVIFYRDSAQKETAEQVMGEVRDAKIWDGKIVTELTPFGAFYRAEEYHQRYFERNPEQGYCRVVIAPKVLKFREKFKDKWIGS